MTLVQILILCFTAEVSIGAPITELPMDKVPENLVGKIYALPKKGKPQLSRSLVETQEPLYLFNRTQTKKGNTIKAVRRFTDLSGNEVVFEEVQYVNNRLQTSYLKHKQLGVETRVTVKGEQLHFWFKSKDGSEDDDEEDIDENTLLAEQIPTFIYAHFKQLLSGEKISFRLIVEDRLETVGFVLKLDTKFKDAQDAKDPSNGTNSEKQHWVIKMSAKSPFVSLKVDPLYFHFVQDPSAPIPKFSHYVGRTKPAIKRGKNFQPLDAVTIF